MSRYKLYKMDEKTPYVKANYLVVELDSYRINTNGVKEYSILNEWTVSNIISKFGDNQRWFHDDFDNHKNPEFNEIFEFSTLEELQKEFIEYLI